MAHFIKREENPLQVERKLQKAAKALGFSKNQKINADIVRDRYVTLVKAHHPDSNIALDIEVHDLVPLDALRKAKDLLLGSMENGDG